jgi:hypothetical protein
MNYNYSRLCRNGTKRLRIETVFPFFVQTVIAERYRLLKEGKRLSLRDVSDVEASISFYSSSKDILPVHQTSATDYKRGFAFILRRS